MSRDIDPRSLPAAITHVFHAAARIGREADSDWRKTFEVNAQVHGEADRRLPRASRGSSSARRDRPTPTKADDRCVRTTPPASTSASTACPRSPGRRWRASPRWSTACPSRSSASSPPTDRSVGLPPTAWIGSGPGRTSSFTPTLRTTTTRSTRTTTCGSASGPCRSASIPPVVVNWAGSETVSAEDYCTYLGELVGKDVSFRYDEHAPWPLWPDVDADARGPRSDAGPLARGHEAHGRGAPGADTVEGLKRRRAPQRLDPYRSGATRSRCNARRGHSAAARVARSTRSASTGVPSTTG